MRGKYVKCCVYALGYGASLEWASMVSRIGLRRTRVIKKTMDKGVDPSSGESMWK